MPILRYGSCQSPFITEPFRRSSGLRAPVAEVRRHRLNYMKLLRPRSRVRCAVFVACSLLTFFACERPPADSHEKSRAVATTRSVTDNPQPDTPNDLLNRGTGVLTVVPMSGPRLVTDSFSAEPRLEIRTKEYVLYLPLEMSRLLYDSLPDFSPVQLSVWHPARVARIVSESRGAALPSVVLGDFNGDSKLDVAMAGKGAQRGTTFILLAKSDSVLTQRLFFISGGGSADSYLTIVRPQRITADPELEREPLDLRTDAVLSAIVEKASVIYYLDHGVLREYSISD